MRFELTASAIAEANRPWLAQGRGAAGARRAPGGDRLKREVFHLDGSRCSR
jgi:hypothetical protein